ncbi:hypothetical protein MTP06_16600 [Streptomyces sp. PLM4]|nr:hypothetical protein MTP06_16600 [Streptomyces sp. PLM4]
MRPRPTHAANAPRNPIARPAIEAIGDPQGQGGRGGAEPSHTASQPPSRGAANPRPEGKPRGRWG